MRISGHREFLIVLLLIGVASPFLLIAADKVHDDYARSLATELQSNLAKLRADYEHRLIELRGASLLFVGDIMLSRSVGQKMEENADYRYPFLNSAETLKEANLTFGNLEGPISSGGANQGSTYSFRADPRVVEGLKFAGFDILSLANNHIWDWGGDALNDTVVLLQENGIETVGAGRNYGEANRPVIKKVNDLTVALLAYTDLYPSSFRATEQAPGISSFNVQAVQEAVGELKKEADIVVVSLHWGEEYASEPSASQRTVARSLIDAGADIVIGHHPHVIQEVEAYGDGWIAYSLGNFIFDQSFSSQTTEGLAIRALVKNKNIVSVEKLRVNISDSFQPTIVQL